MNDMINFNRLSGEFILLIVLLKITFLIIIIYTSQRKILAKDLPRCHKIKLLRNLKKDLEKLQGTNTAFAGKGRCDYIS